MLGKSARAHCGRVLPNGSYIGGLPVRQRLVRRIGRAREKVLLQRELRGERFDVTT